MRRQIIISLAAAVILGMSVASAQQNGIDSALYEVERLYESGSYVNAEVEARRLLDDPLLTDAARVQAEKWIAFSLVAQGRNPAARERFMNCFRLDPAFSLDPLLTSPKIMAVYNDAKNRMAEEIAARESSKTSNGTLVSRKITFRTILFPGYEQLYQRLSVKGYAFLGAGIAALGSAVTFELLRSSAKEDYLAAALPDEISSKYDTYNSYHKARNYSLVAFALIYLASEIDVFFFSEETTISITPSHSNSSGISLSLRVVF